MRKTEEASTTTRTVAKHTLTVAKFGRPTLWHAPLLYHTGLVTAIVTSAQITHSLAL